jgi:hypothetical protein
MRQQQFFQFDAGLVDRSEELFDIAARIDQGGADAWFRTRSANSSAGRG